MQETPVDLDRLLAEMVRRNASDLYLKAYTPPYLRVDGVLVEAGTDPLTPPQTEALSASLMSEQEASAFADSLELDLAIDRGDLGRFRVNVYRQQATVSLVFRAIRRQMQTFAELNLPASVLERLSMEPRGLVLLTGVAGSGKSTTIAAMIEYVNEHAAKHIVTIEDPVEFVFTDRKSIISQREVGLDTRSFPSALRHVIRQSPDVIFIGEMRDLETISSAIMAAETGHLVLSTLHTMDATQTVERIINFFPPYQHPQVRMQLSLILKGVISMRLLPRADGAGRVPACEILLLTPTVRKIIHEGRTPDLLDAMKRGEIYGMQTFNQALVKWVAAGTVTQEEAMRYADNPEELALEFRGIYSGANTHGKDR